jgi:hypothetical protein
MFFKKKPKVTIPKNFWVSLSYNGSFKPNKDKSILSFDFKVGNSESKGKLREILPELISDLCKDYPTAIIVRDCSDPPQKEFNSVEIGNGADISSLKSYYENEAFEFSTHLYVVSSKSEIQIRDENKEKLIEKLLDMPYIFYLYFDSVSNLAEIRADVNVIDADSIVESVKKLCKEREISLNIYIVYDKPKCEE